MSYTASVWMFVFAAMSFYWALGGTTGLNTVSLGQEVTGESWFIAALWLTGILKVGGGLLALALVQTWGQQIPRRLLLIAAWGVGAVLVIHGGDFVIQGALTEAGLISLSSPTAWTPDHWQTFVWGPWWLLGGLFFCLSAWNYQLKSRNQQFR
ncbi:DUF3995 domain-containing protein [Haladaptatus sp. DYF46]|uniref:DUF3995 domain-containing protein n=1 Tax=Haladaptatus sp. DYF46 TaxID=2886041 RepID=UPI001E5557C1